MASPVSLIALQFLDWIAARPRTYEDAMGAWRTSCPRLSVWEDMTIDGYVTFSEDGRHVVLTEKGRRARGEAAPDHTRQMAAE